MIHDEQCRRAVDKNPNLMVPWYLMAIVAYEMQDDPIISDALFDELGTRLRGEFPFIRHQHSYLLQSAMKDPERTKPTSLDMDHDLFTGVVKDRVFGALSALRTSKHKQPELF